MKKIAFWALTVGSIVTSAGHDNNRSTRKLLALRGRESKKKLYDNNKIITPTDYNIPTSNITLPIHAHSGTHHVYVFVGSPPQRQTLIIDTGSKAMAFPCKTCKTCNNCCGVHASPYFDPSLSTTHFVSKCSNGYATHGNNNSNGCLLGGISECSLMGNYCSFRQKYTEGSSWVATEVEDIVWLGTSSVVESLEVYMPKLAIAYPFGCQTSSKGLFRKQYADGILGLSIHETSIVSALWREGVIERNAFSLCLTREDGYLTLGGTPTTTGNTANLNGSTSTANVNMKLTPITQDHGYYSIEVIRIYIGDTLIAATMSDNGDIIDHAGDTNKTSIKNNNTNIRSHLLDHMNAGKGCILDSGTTDTFFPSGLEKVFRKVVVNHHNNNNNDDESTNHTLSENNALPTSSTMTRKRRTEEVKDYFSNKFRKHMYSYNEFLNLPTITLEFANQVRMDIPPENYMENVPRYDTSTNANTNTATAAGEENERRGTVLPWDNSILLINRIYFEESGNDDAGGSCVLGANSMFGYNVLFDLEGLQIGITKADCYKK